MKSHSEPRRFLRVQPGEVYNRLTVLSLVTAVGSEGRPGCVARCVCGDEREYQAKYLRTGHTKSCGCLKREAMSARFKTHGRGSASRPDPTYQAWARMIGRCSTTDTASATYADYVARGITVCARWLESFEAFAADMGDVPPGKTLDRKDNDKGYDPSNCRWATPTEQARNRRSNRLVTIDGVTRCLVEWCELTGVPQKIASGRIAIGWTPERAVTTPHRPMACRAA